MEQTIKVAVRSKDVISISMLENLQGNLKTLSDENYKKLKNEILLDGFSFAVHIFEDPASAKIYIIDGHQRVEALRRMRNEGYSVPQIPVVFVEADDLDHAKRKVLAAASQYGIFDQSGAEDFIKTIHGVDLDYLHKSISMPFVNFDVMTFEEVDKILVNSHLRERNDPNGDWSDENVQGLYSNKIATPIYEPTGEKPAINDLIDLDKYKSLCNEIHKTSFSKEEKEFLILAASRHIVFNYEKIANYYAHSDKQLQEQFENSALVIIDFNKAVENGFVKLSDEINRSFVNNSENDNETFEEGLLI